MLVDTEVYIVVFSKCLSFFVFVSFLLSRAKFQTCIEFLSASAGADTDDVRVGRHVTTCPRFKFSVLKAHYYWFIIGWLMHNTAECIGLQPEMRMESGQKL